jgi:hypothetical protein
MLCNQHTTLLSDENSNINTCFNINVFIEQHRCTKFRQEIGKPRVISRSNACFNINDEKVMLLK